MEGDARVRVYGLDCSRKPVDLMDCELFEISKYTDAYMSEVQAVFYLTQDGRWIVPIVHPGANETLYKESHPVMVARRFLDLEQPLPKVLQPYREQATGKNYGQWLVEFADETCRNSIYRENVTVVVPEVKATAIPVKATAVESKPRESKESRGEKNARLRDYLARKLSPTANQASRALDIPAGTIRGLPAWKARFTTSSGDLRIKPPPPQSDLAYPYHEKLYVNSLTEEQRHAFWGLHSNLKKMRVADFIINQELLG